MKRKKLFSWVVFLSLGLLGTLLLGSSLFTSTANAQIKLSYANFPPAPTFPCVQMERWKTEVEKRTTGKVKVDPYPGSTLLNPKNMFDGVAAGTADIGSTATSYFPGMFPIVEFIDLPIGWHRPTRAQP